MYAKTEVKFRPQFSFKFSDTITGGLLTSRHFLVQNQQRKDQTNCEICSKLTIKAPDRRN